MAKKSIFLTYLLWLFGGFFGFHHFYLGRDIQGFLWWSTLGGYIGGWLRDLFFIPSYVKAANFDDTYMSKLSETIRHYKNPPFSSLRFCGMTIVSYMWGSIIHAAIPKEELFGIDWNFLCMLEPLVCALGVWTVGNIGHEEGALKWPLIAAYVTFPYYMKQPGELSYTIMVTAACLAFELKSKQWKQRVKPQKHFLRRTAVIMISASVYLGLLTSVVYFNATIFDGDGNEIPVREAINHFFTSPWWNDLGQCLWDTYEFAKIHGWQEVLNRMVEMLDPYGEQNAFVVLSLELGANQTVINSKCRQLAVKWHPDKFKEAEEKLRAQEEFYKVQQACEILSTSKAKRRKKNKKSV